MIQNLLLKDFGKMMCSLKKCILFVLFPAVIIPSFNNLYSMDIGWSTKANMPTARWILASGVVNNKIYAIGGNNGTDLSTVEEYDPTTNTWSTKASMPAARSQLAIGVVNNKIYAIGGYTGGGIISTVEEYDPATDIWSTKASMPTARHGLAIGVVNNKIYAIGGYTSQNVTSTVEEYDPATNTWSTKASMPTARYWFSAGVINNKIYAIGGQAGGIISTVEEYDPATDIWTTKASMPTARYWLSAGVINNKIYAIGGVDKNTVEEYDPATNTWLTKASLLNNRYGSGVGVANNKIYVIGGYAGGALSTVEEGNAYTFDHYNVSVSTTVNAGSIFTVTITAIDTNNQTIPTYSGNVTIQALLANTTSLIGTGNLSVTGANVSSGTVIVSNQTYNKAENIKIKVTDTNGNTGISDTINVISNTADKINISANPGSIISGQSSALTSTLVDIYGNPVQNAAVQFSVLKGRGSVSGSTVYTSSSGLATTTFTCNTFNAELDTIRVTAANLAADVNINVSVLLIGGIGGIVTLSEDPNTKVIIPSGAILENISVLIKLLNGMAQADIDACNAAGIKTNVQTISTSTIREFTAQKTDGTDYGNFSELTTIEIPYADANNDDIADGTNISVDDLRMMRLNETTEKWEAVSDGGVNTVDKVNKVVKTEVRHLSIYTIGKVVSAPTLSGVNVYPNPFNPKKQIQGLTISNLTVNATVKIYTAAGELVRELTDSNSVGIVNWNGKNDDGAEVASGVYIGCIKSPDGKKRIKIAVER